jgi:nitroreductase
MEVQEAIKSRRSIRKYKTDPVDDKTLGLVLEAARLAPSWDNSQCWRFVVVQDGEIKRELAETLPESNPARKAVQNAPVVIAACAELGGAGYIGGKIASDKGDWFMFDVALAMQNLVLAAQSLGLGTVYIGWFNEAKVSQVLEIPEGTCIVAMTPLGYPDQQRDPTPRKELGEIVFHERFGQR